MKRTGFTIVELLVVIAVIGILASTTTVSYLGSIDDANDTKIRSTVKTAGDAIQLNEMQNNARITGTGKFNVANGVDTLVPANLKYGYRNEIKSKNVADSDSVFLFYNCGDGGGGFVIYASLNRPTAEDKSNFSTIRTRCAQTSGQVPGPDTNPGYNYAQIF